MSGSIKLVRAEMGLTQLQMATLMGLRVHRYSEIERGYNGRKPTNGHWACVRLIEHCDRAGIIDKVLASYNT